MFVGIDVHKHAHAAALIDERGGELGTLTVPNSPEGYRRRPNSTTPAFRGDRRVSAPELQRRGERWGLSSVTAFCPSIDALHAVRHAMP